MPAPRFIDKPIDKSWRNDKAILVRSPSLSVEFSIMSRGTRTIEIYRYDPDKDAAPRMQTYTIELLDSDRMLLDLLLRLKSKMKLLLSVALVVKVSVALMV